MSSLGGAASWYVPTRTTLCGSQHAQDSKITRDLRDSGSGLVVAVKSAEDALERRGQMGVSFFFEREGHPPVCFIETIRRSYKVLPKQKQKLKPARQCFELHRAEITISSRNAQKQSRRNQHHTTPGLGHPWEETTAAVAETPAGRLLFGPDPHAILKASSATFLILATPSRSVFFLFGPLTAC